MKIPAFERRMLKLLVGFPSTGELVAKFGISLTNMLGYLMATKVPGYREQQVIPMHVQGSILSRSRMKIVQAALQQDCSHLLFVDTDQVFPRDTAHRLLQWGKPIVACNIATKQFPANPTARVRAADQPDGYPLFSNPGESGLAEVWRIGAGVMLVDMQVFRKIGLGVFEIRWVPEIQDYRGEDWSFCEAAQAAGYKIFIDHGLSQEVEHVGQFAYKHDHIVESVQVKEIPQTAVEIAK